MPLSKTFKTWIASKINCCFFLKSKNPELMKTYQEFQTEAENKILFALNIILVLFNIVIVILFRMAARIDILGYILLGVSVIALFIRKISTKLWKVFIVLSSTTFLNYIHKSAQLEQKISPLSGEFIMGNSIGMAEYLIILSLKSTGGKIFMIACYCITKVVTFYQAFTVGVSVIYGSLLVFCIGYCIYYDYTEGQNFKAFYKSREEARKFQNLVNHDFPTSVLILDSELNYIYSNEFFKEKLGSDILSVPSLLRKFEICTIQEDHVKHTEDDYPSNLYKYLRKVSKNPHVLLEEKEGYIFLAMLLNTTVNTTYHYEIRIRNILWGLNPAYAVIFNDTSDKEILMGLKHTDQQKNRVINTLSHELKTPINGILGLVRIIKARVQDQVSQTYLDYCEGCTKLLLNFINSLLDYNEFKQGTLRISKTSFSLDGMLKDLQFLYNFHAEQKGLKFTVEKDPNIPDTISTDKDRLVMVLITLLGNAFKFTSNGSVNLKVSCQEKYLEFRVNDTGTGIIEEEQENLFKTIRQMFDSEKNSSTHGIGLGLPTMNEFVKLLNEGDEDAGLKVESVLCKGSSFYFTVRVSEGSRSQSISEEEESSNISLQNLEVREILTSQELVTKKITCVTSHKDTYHFLTSPLETKEEVSLIQAHPVIDECIEKKPFPKNILIVDDNPFNILAVSFILEKFHCQITKAFNGHECLKVLEENVLRGEEQKFDLILMDIQMPVLDGVDTSRMITERIEEGRMYKVPVVALTANRVDNAERERYKQNGILKCLEKPLKEVELQKCLCALGFKQFEN